MKRSQLLVVLFAVSAAVCFADPVKLRFNAITDLVGSLREMDGVEKVYENVAGQNGATNTRILRVPYDLKTPVRIALAKDLSALKQALDAFEQKRQVALNTVSPGAPERVQNDPALLAKFVTAWNAAVLEPVIVDLVLISEEDLNLDKNKDLPGSVLSGLGPIIKTK